LSTTTFFRAFKWSIAGEIITKAIQPLIFIILARLLTPNDYGVVAAALMVISFTQIFWEAGMAKALIQRQTQVNESANVAFWINLAAGIFIALILFLSADQLANYLFKDARIGNILRAMTLQIFFGALTSVPVALLQKELKFNMLFWVRLTTVAVPAVFSIPLAIYGFSYWALVIGTLAGQAIQVVVLWWISTWRPSFTFHRSIAKELLVFGSWVGLSGLLTWFYLWIDSLFVGSFLGTHQLGIYRTGNQFIIMIFGFLFTPLQPVLYSYFSGIQNEQEKLKNIFFRVIRITTLISVPLGFVLYVSADAIALIVFGEKWHGIEFVLAIMAIMHGYSWIVGLNGEIYRAINKPSYETIVNSIALIIYLGGYYVSILHGFETFVWTRLGLSLGSIGLHLLFGWMALRLSVLKILRITFLATLTGLIALGAKALISLFIADPIFQLITIGLTCGIFMGGVLFLTERDGAVKDLLNLWNNSMKKSDQL
jgi:PST family polysaccharide transporter